MYAIVVPGKVGAVSVVYASAAEALEKYRQMEAEGLRNIDVKNARGEPVNVSDLEQGVGEAGATPQT